MSSKEEKTSLLGRVEAVFGKNTPSDESQPKEEAGVDAGKNTKNVGTKRERLKRSPSLDKVDETEEKSTKGWTDKAKYGCPDYFGVKSYLHDFYDTHFYKDPDLYEEDTDDLRYLLHPKPRRRRCTSIWWKIFVYIGANFLIFGIVGVLIGYLVPQRTVIIGSISNNIEIIDREAMGYNYHLDLCKLIGLALFCTGGVTLTAALLVPSCLQSYCEDDKRDSSFLVAVSPTVETQPLKSPIEMSIPYTSKVSSVQPGRKSDESLITQEGLVLITD